MTLVFGLSLVAASGAASLPMPDVRDFTQVWWQDGFPGRVDGAPWYRCIRTGYYGLVMDTATIRIPHFGPLSKTAGYGPVSEADRQQLAALPAADLKLRITANGIVYHCTAGGSWTRFTGPRLIESGRFLQRVDVTDLVFKADDGLLLPVDARLEVAAWPDRLGMILAARPGEMPIPAGEDSFGKIAGGFGFDGSNHLELPNSPELEPEQFTLAMWAYIPVDYQPSKRTPPWLVCKNYNEAADGGYGLVLQNQRIEAILNIGGGKDGYFRVTAPESESVKINAWNHIAMSYDGDILRLYVNGKAAGEAKVGRTRKPGKGNLVFGRRGDNAGDGFHFRGVLDEITLYDRALSDKDIKTAFQKPGAAAPGSAPVRALSFRADGLAAQSPPRAPWRDARIDISLTTAAGTVAGQWTQPAGLAWEGDAWQQASVVADPAGSVPPQLPAPIRVEATALPKGDSRPVTFEAAVGWYRINLDGIEPIVPPDRGPAAANDAVERIKLVLTNPSGSEQTARLMFEKTAHGFRQRIGSAVTGMTAMLRDAEGNPTGIPVQLSKNWHNDPLAGVYSGAWFHGISQVRLPAGATVELELTLAYGNWGGIAAASHAQLSLIGWGSNQLWDESAMGSWGESICYEPDQVQGQCTILDVRPVMVHSMDRNNEWSWTHNVGGGDFLRMFDPAGKRMVHRGNQASYLRHGPCLTEVTYAGRLFDGAEHAVTVSLARTDDIVRGIYRIRFDVSKALDFSRLVIFQIGADTYSYTGERKMAIGNETGLTKEWDTQWGGDTYRTAPMECVGRIPWVSLHEAVHRAKERPEGAWANRGVVIRSWQARLGGRDAAPWAAERGIRAGASSSSTIDIVPPPGVSRLEPGDFVEAVIEHVVMPQFAKDYYGPNAALKAALATDENSWRMIHREAVGNNRSVQVTTGSLQRLYPAVTVASAGEAADFTLTGSLAFVPVTITGLASPRGHTLLIDGQPLNQAVHGNDFWQADYDAAGKTWSLTYSVPADGKAASHIELRTAP